jgi:predicted nucleic acid-binding protein
MNAKTFVDTNLLVYAQDKNEGTKQEAAKRILQSLMQQRSGALSIQVLQEFYNTVTRKVSRPITKQEARAIVEDFAYWCVATTPAEISLAFRIEDEAKINFWDAMIVAAAIKAGATRILSEDLSHGWTIAGVKIENPFAAS